MLVPGARGGLDARMAVDPHALFEEWFAEARLADPDLPEAMSVATCGADRQPSTRMVLLKQHDERGFVFFTNGESRKGETLAANPRAALLFYWKPLKRQVRIEGPVEPVSDAEADAYFATRVREAQLGAWASDQSRPMASRRRFEERYQALAERYEGRDVPRPPHWRGYRVVPERIEFWTDRAHRLHERRLFVRDGDGWTESLLYP